MSTPIGTLPFSSETILSRQASPFPHQNLEETLLQNEADQLVSGFLDQATDVKTLAALTAGGLAYRYGKIGVMGSQLGHVTAMPLRPLAIAVGLGSEVTAYELTQRSLISLSPEGEGRGEGGQGRNLWSWSGPGGWKQSLITDLITFGTLKGAGYLSRESNVILQHSFASAAMVAGHQTSSELGIIPKPEGTLAEQFLRAEVTNIQLGAGTSLVYAMAPGITALERGLDLSLQSRDVGVGLVSTLGKGNHKGLLLQPNATATVGIPSLLTSHSSPETSHLLLMATKDKNNPLGSGKGTISFGGGALAVGGEKALQWLQAIRENSHKEKILFWIPNEFYEMVLLNEFDLVVHHDKKDLLPLNLGENIPIKALSPLLKSDEIVRMPPNYRQEIEKIITRWNDRTKYNLEQLYDWDWVLKELGKICSTKAGVKEIRKENGKRWIFFHDGKKELLPPNVLVHPDSKNRNDPSSAEALTRFENQFWDTSPQEMEKRVGTKLLRKLPERTIISQFISPGAILLPDYGKPLQGIKGVKVFVFQHPHSWVNDFSREIPATVTQTVSPHILEYLKMISGMPQPKPSPPPQLPEPAPIDQGIPQAIDEQNALPMVDSRPIPSPQNPPPAVGKPGKNRIETDPTQPLKSDDLKDIIEEASRLPFAKTSPEGEPIIPSPSHFRPQWGKRIYRAVQRIFTFFQIKWMEFRIERIFKAGQTPSSDQVRRLNNLRERNRSLQRPPQELPKSEK